MELDELTIRPLVRAELDTAIGWAADEGWNPGLHDADAFWAADPEGFVGAEHRGELVATGSVVSYGASYGFMGLFIVRRDLRGQGVGTKLWFHRRDLLKSRLGPGAAIGMDGVFEMQDWYRRGGFEFTHRNLRMEGRGGSARSGPEIVELSGVPFDQLVGYDRGCFGCARERFLKGWVEMPEAHALAFLREGQVWGYGVVRRCRQGYKIGPLFADDAGVADALFRSLGGRVSGEPLWLDVPENNAAAMALAERHGMREVFGCARMYHGPPPPASWDRTFGITTFELG